MAEKSQAVMVADDTQADMRSPGPNARQDMQEMYRLHCMSWFPATALWTLLEGSSANITLAL